MVAQPIQVRIKTLIDLLVMLLMACIRLSTLTRQAYEQSGVVGLIEILLHQALFFQFFYRLGNGSLRDAEFSRDLGYVQITIITNNLHYMDLTSIDIYIRPIITRSFACISNFFSHYHKFLNYDIQLLSHTAIVYRLYVSIYCALGILCFLRFQENSRLCSTSAHRAIQYIDRCLAHKRGEANERVVRFVTYRHNKLDTVRFVDNQTCNGSVTFGNDTGVERREI